MVTAGITVHYLYAALGMLPSNRPSLGEMVRFSIDYTFWAECRIRNCRRIAFVDALEIRSEW
jgi:hypothetical protein